MSLHLHPQTPAQPAVVSSVVARTSTRLLHRLERYLDEKRMATHPCTRLGMRLDRMVDKVMIELDQRGA